MYLDRNGNPLTLEEWADSFGKDFETSRRVDETTVGRHWISTVWLGLDHQFHPDGPPQIFETMIFRDSGNESEGPSYETPIFHTARWGYKRNLHIADYQWRYSTEEQALAGHRAVVRKVEDAYAWPVIAVLLAVMCLLLVLVSAL